MEHWDLERRGVEAISRGGGERCLDSKVARSSGRAGKKHVEAVLSWSNVHECVNALV